MEYKLRITKDKGDTIEVYLDPNKHPIAYQTKKRELMRCSGLTDEEADSFLMEIPFILEIFYSPDQGLFAVEAEPIGEIEIYNPYDGCKIPNENLTARIYTYVLIGTEATRQFNSFGLLPSATGNNNDEKFHFFRSFDSKFERDAYLTGLNDGNISEDYILIEDAESVLNKWWKQAPTGLQNVFSVTAEYNSDSNREFWENLSFTEKKNIYSWCKIKAYDINVNEDNLNSLRLEMTSRLADLSISLKYDKPIEDMCDEDGSFLEAFQDDFNRVLDEIENRIMNYDYQA